jgi:predicted enzyme related to lactoylglutathione lyase
MAGEVVHVELLAHDADRAQGFWQGLFGWDIQGSGMPGMDYRMAQAAESQGIAIYPSEERPGQMQVYFGTDDIERSIAKVRELGGEAGDRMPVPGHGWFSPCKDTEAIGFNLWQPDPSAG